MFMKVENSGSTERLLNLDLVEVVEMDRNRKSATIYNKGSIVVADSAILYRYYSSLDLEAAPQEEPKSVGV